jgi:hypothetical protein
LPSTGLSFTANPLFYLGSDFVRIPRLGQTAIGLMQPDGNRRSQLFDLWACSFFLPPE